MASSGGPGDDEDDGMDFFEMLGIKNRDRMDGVCHLLPAVCVCVMCVVECVRAPHSFFHSRRCTFWLGHGCVTRGGCEWSSGVVVALPLHDGNAAMVEFIHGTVLRALCVLHRELCAQRAVHNFM
jgi:hypothetical protein